MPRLSHSTLESSPDEQGNTHRLEILPNSKQVRGDRAFYEAKAFPYPKDKIRLEDRNVTAIFQHGTATNRNWARIEVIKNSVARNLIQHFEGSRPSCHWRLRVLEVQTATLDRVCFWSKTRDVGEALIFVERQKQEFEFFDRDGKNMTENKKEKSLKGSLTRRFSTRKKRNDTHQFRRSFSVEKGEPAEEVLPPRVMPSAPPLEDDLPPSYEESEIIENFRRMSDYNGNPQMTFHSKQRQVYQRTRSTSTCSSSSYSSQEDTEDHPHPLLNAFIHFSLLESKGRRVVSELRGSYDEDGNYTLTTPTFHSVTREYGDHDEGVQGIRKVCGNHTCSEMCKDLPPVTELLNNACPNNI